MEWVGIRSLILRMSRKLPDLRQTACLWAVLGVGRKPEEMRAQYSSTRFCLPRLSLLAGWLGIQQKLPPAMERTVATPRKILVMQNSTAPLTERPQWILPNVFRGRIN